jgi:glutathione S-transferase
MLTLLSHPGGSGLYSYGMFCTKAAYLLQMSGEAWQREDFFDLAAMPHGKLPVLREGDALIADSEAIRRFLEDRGADFDPGLTAQQKAESRLLIRWLDEALWAHVVTARWHEEEGWAQLRTSVLGMAPEAIADQIRARMNLGLDFIGITRHSKAERLLRLHQDLTALQARLGGGPFLYGTQITAADCSAAPMIEALSGAPADPEVVEAARAYPVLQDYAARVAAAVPLQMPAAAA